jgi:hypothetical protein
VDSERALRSEFRRALDDVLPPAPWLPTSVAEGLREERRKMGPRRPFVIVRLPRFSQKVAAAVLLVVMAAAAVGVFLAAQRLGSQSAPAGGGARPHSMPSGTVNLKAATYAVAFPQFDAPGKPFPKLLITVPDGWRINDGFALSGHSDTSRQLIVTIWDVVDVYTDGCHWLGPMIHPGPTADELAAVLAARPLRNATAPVAASLGGYEGKYLQWSVPADINFSDCDRSPGGSAFFKSWNDVGGDRFQQFPGQVDWLWILDIEGHRLLIDATWLQGATEQDRVELAEVVSSIAFKR